MKFRVLVERSPETGNFLAYCPEIVGCAAVAPSRERALDRVRELILKLMRPEPARLARGIEAAEVEL